MRREAHGDFKVVFFLKVDGGHYWYCYSLYPKHINIPLYQLMFNKKYLRFQAGLNFGVHQLTPPGTDRIPQVRG